MSSFLVDPFRREIRCRRHAPQQNCILSPSRAMFATFQTSHVAHHVPVHSSSTFCPHLVLFVHSRVFCLVFLTSPGLYSSFVLESLQVSFCLYTHSPSSPYPWLGLSLRTSLGSCTPTLNHILSPTPLSLFPPFVPCPFTFC